MSSKYIPGLGLVAISSNKTPEEIDATFNYYENVAPKYEALGGFKQGFDDTHSIAYEGWKQLNRTEDENKNAWMQRQVEEWGGMVGFTDSVNLEEYYKQIEKIRKLSPIEEGDRGSNILAMENFKGDMYNAYDNEDGDISDVQSKYGYDEEQLGVLTGLAAMGKMAFTDTGYMAGQITGMVVKDPELLLLSMFRIPAMAAQLTSRATQLATMALKVQPKYVQGLSKAIQSQRDTDKEINKIQERITLQIKEQKDLAEDKATAEKDALQLQREAEAARKQAISEAEADAKWLANQRIQIAQETELRLIQDEEQRELRSLEIQHEAAKEELALRGGTLTDKLALEQSYLMDKEAIEGDYAARAEEKRKQQEEKDIADAATLTEALATDQENELQRARDKYAALQELAVVDSQESLDLAEQLGQEEVAIIEKFEKQKRDADIKTQNLKIQGMIKLANATRGILGSLSDMAEGNAEQQRKLAIVDVLLSQAIAVGNAVAGATAAGLGTAAAAPLTTPIFIAQMVGSVMASFAGIKGILNQAGASMPSGGGRSSGGGGGFVSNAQVPLPSRLDTPDSMQAYVVQSQLQGQINSQGRLDSQIIL